MNPRRAVSDQRSGFSSVSGGISGDHGITCPVTVIDRKPTLVFVPNIPIDVLANHNPTAGLHLNVSSILEHAKVRRWSSPRGLATWLGNRGLGGPEKITLFTHADTIAIDAGEESICNGEIGHHRAFHILSHAWYGGDISVFKMGYLYYALKPVFKEMYFMTGEKPRQSGVPLTELVAEQRLDSSKA